MFSFFSFSKFLCYIWLLRNWKKIKEGGICLILKSVFFNLPLVPLFIFSFTHLFGCLESGGKMKKTRALALEVAIGRAGLGCAGPTLGRAKTGPGQNWPGFFGPKF